MNRSMETDVMYSSVTGRIACRRPLARPYRRFVCNLLGHVVDNRIFVRDRAAPYRCSCGERILRADGTHTHVGHTVSCFLLGHVYESAGARDGHVEYVCTRCGHPLLLEAMSARVRTNRFRKMVRYACGIYGHSVHGVSKRNGFVEYACSCGHSFLVPNSALDTIRHPAMCVLRGHYIRYVASRFDFDEYRCSDCGHPFSFPARR